MATMTTDEVKVCVFCDVEASYLERNGIELAYCSVCRDYKGIMTISAWEEYTGEKWNPADEDDEKN